MEIPYFRAVRGDFSPTKLICFEQVRGGELVLSTTEYSCSENGQELQFHFKNDSLIDELHSFQIRRIEFCLNGIRLVAKGNLIYQSSLPEGADYYFIIDDDGIVQLSRSERILYMRKVSRS